MRGLLLILLCVLCTTVQLFAQNRTITGKITDERGSAIPQASIIIKGTTSGTTTDANGNFSLSVPANARTLVISSVGMTNKEISITNNETYAVLLAPSNSSMQEVVVVGYGTQ